MKQTLTALTVAATMFASSASAFEPDDLQKLKDTGNCERCDLMGADLSGADLSDANLIFTEMNGANLSGALLKEADLFGANLEGAIMRGAILCKTLMPDYSMNDSGC